MVEPVPHFGRVLLERKPSQDIGGLIFLFVLGLPILLAVFIPDAPAEIKALAFFLGGGLVAFSLVMLWRRWMHVFLQERGIREYRQRRGRSLSYDSVDEITYSSLRIFMHGSYIHTLEKLALQADRDSGPPLVFTHLFKEANPRGGETRTAVGDVRDAVSAAVAERLAERLVGGNSVAWTPQLRIHRVGLEFADGKAGAQTVEWRRVSKAALDQGKLRIWIDADAQPRIETPTHGPNFYPGYELARQFAGHAF